MNRRQLLTTGVAATATATFSRSEALGVLATTAAAFTVRSGEGRPGGQWTVHGEKAFSTKVAGHDVGSRYAILEIHTPPGLGPELHIHKGQNELFFVLMGSIGLQCGSERTILKPGDTFMAPADIPHASAKIAEVFAKHGMKVVGPPLSAASFSS